METESNFIEDIRAKLAMDLQQLGYPLPAPTRDAYNDAHRICVDHWNAFARRIQARPRTVHRSRELQARGQSAPPFDVGLAAAEQELRAGDNLTPRLSRRLTDRTFNDKMLNDWGIHHLHLGTAVDIDGFVKRTGDVLFVMLRPDDAYLLDVRAHGAWADADLVELIHDNWPETIARWALKGIRLSTTLTTSQRQNLRSKNANAGVQTRDGTYYVAIGGGLVGSGDNFGAIRWGDYMLMTAKSIEGAVATFDSESIADEVMTATGARPDRLIYRLAEFGRDYALVLVENAAKPFAIKIPIEQSEPVTIDLRANPT